MSGSRATPSGADFINPFASSCKVPISRQLPRIENSRFCGIKLSESAWAAWVGKLKIVVK